MAVHIEDPERCVLPVRKLGVGREQMVEKEAKSVVRRRDMCVLRLKERDSLKESVGARLEQGIRVRPISHLEFAGAS